MLGANLCGWLKPVLVLSYLTITWLHEQAVEQGEYVILLGDFNTDERHNCTRRLWSDEIQMTPRTEENEIDEIEIFQNTKYANIESLPRKYIIFPIQTYAPLDICI